MQVPTKNGCSKASVQWFLDDRPYGKPHLLQQQTSHFYQGRCPTLAHQGRVQTAYLQELTAALGRTYEAVSTLAEKGPVIYHGNL